MSHKVPTRKVGTGALVASRIISTVHAKLLSVIVYNSAAVEQFIQVHETAAVPAEGSVPALPAIPVAAGAVVQFDVGGLGIDLDAITICNSSTAATKTIGAANCAIVGILHG